MVTARFEAIGKRYAGGFTALQDFDLALNDGEFLVLLGPSGSGKSTLLRILAGLEAPTEGRVWIGDDDVTDRDPGARDIAMVFQSYALYPHKSVRDNLGFGLRMRGMPRAEVTERTRAIAEKLELQSLLDRRPAELSGGQRQRVALGRALVRRPRLFLLDEPLSNLDAKLRLQMRAELARLHEEFGVTTLYVTHDQEEAMTLGQRIAVLSRGGQIEQVGTPSEIYNAPASQFVADFVGTPSMNWLRAERVRAGEEDVFRGEGFEFHASDVLAEDERVPEVTALQLGVRPHDWTLGSERPSALRARVELVELLGATSLVHAKSASVSDLRLVLSADHTVRKGDQLSLYPARGRLHVFDAEHGLRVSTRAG